MRRPWTLLPALLILAAVQPLRAQDNALARDLVKAVDQTEQKLTALANALNDEQYNWRPGEGVRSAAEVVLHVAADNYFIPLAMGVPAPEAVKMSSPNDYAAAQAFEKRNLPRDAAAAEMKASFEHLRKALNSIPPARYNEKIQVFGQEFTVQEMMLAAVLHLHEHLGQMIAYARTNNVVPPWSR